MAERDEFEYRNWLLEQIDDAVVGRLSGEGKGIDALYTDSLENLYRAIYRSNPREDYKEYMGEK